MRGDHLRAIVLKFRRGEVPDVDLVLAVAIEDIVPGVPVR